MVVNVREVNRPFGDVLPQEPHPSYQMVRVLLMLPPEGTYCAFMDLVSVFIAYSYLKFLAYLGLCWGCQGFLKISLRLHAALVIW